METKIYTEDDFDEFKEHCIRWLYKLGISEYEIDFKHHVLDGDAAARTTYNVKSKLACFQLTTTLNGDFCFQNDINKLALHECLHLLFADFGNTIDKTDFDSELSIAAEHAVVQRLLKAML